MKNSNLNYASPGFRLLSYLVDKLIGMVILLALVHFTLGSGSMFELLDTILLIIVFAIYFGFLWPLFNSYLTSKLGGSIGKILTGVRVTDETGNLLTFKRSFFREFVSVMVSQTFLGLGYFWIFKDEKRRTWHDMATQSVVIVSGNTPVFGILSLIALFLMSAFFAFSIFTNFKNNSMLYKNTFDDLKNFFSEEDMTYPTPYPEEFLDEEFEFNDLPENDVEIETF